MNKTLSWALIISTVILIIFFIPVFADHTNEWNDHCPNGYAHSHTHFDGGTSISAADKLYQDGYVHCHEYDIVVEATPTFTPTPTITPMPTFTVTPTKVIATSTKVATSTKITPTLTFTVTPTPTPVVSEKQAVEGKDTTPTITPILEINTGDDNRNTKKRKSVYKAPKWDRCAIALRQKHNMAGCLEFNYAPEIKRIQKDSRPTPVTQIIPTPVSIIELGAYIIESDGN